MIPEPRAGWELDAECRGTDPRLFYAEFDGAAGSKWYQEMGWRAMCPQCPVRAECLAHALLQRERWGVWGGLTPTARRNIESFLASGAVTWVQLTSRWTPPNP